MTWNIPNTLSVFRLIAALALPVLVVILPRPVSDWVALILFVGASVTDWIDGYLARAWNQMTRFGAMIDPIADKAMVLSALLVLAVTIASSQNTAGFIAYFMVPASIIAFREVFVSGLREYLGAEARLLKVTKLAKWKTTAQMTAITVLLLYGVFEHSVGAVMFGMGAEMALSVLGGTAPDEVGLGWRVSAMTWTWWGGLTLFWVAGVLTFITGWDYFSKARPFLQDNR